MTTPAEAALRYADAGWPVFPCRPRGKEPTTSRGYYEATADPEQVAAWWREVPDANIGFVPGLAGLLVIDVDGPEGEATAGRLGLLSEPTLAVLTPRGRHLYYLHPGGEVGNRRVGVGLDIRADRGYVLLPPSVHPSGSRYHWQGRLDEVIPLPPLALEALRPLEPERPATTWTGTAGPRSSRYAAAAIAAECLELAAVAEGGRNIALNKAAYALARFVAQGEAQLHPVVTALAAAAAAAGLPEHEIERTISSAFRAREVAA